MSFYLKSIQLFVGSTGQRDADLTIRTADGGYFHFILFETRRMESALELISRANLLQSTPAIRSIPMTGGGAYKFSHLFEKLPVRPNVSTNVTATAVPSTLNIPTESNMEQLPSAQKTEHDTSTAEQAETIRVKRLDEMRCLVNGLNFLLRYLPSECFYYKLLHRSHPSEPPPSPADIGPATEGKRIEFVPDGDGIFPYILVNIGTGVSIIKVEADGRFERVSGSGLGGGTYWGKDIVFLDV